MWESRRASAGAPLACPKSKGRARHEFGGNGWNHSDTEAAVKTKIFFSAVLRCEKFGVERE